MIAISILAFIFVITYSSLTAIIETKRSLEDARDSATIAASVLSRMTRELQLAYDQSNLMPPKESPNQTIPSRVCLKGSNKLLASGERGDTITFLALEGGQYLPDGGTHSGLVQITYRIEEDPEAPKATMNQRGETVQRYYLVREETPYMRPFSDAYKKTMIFPVTDAVIRLEARYQQRDAEEWKEQWGEDPQGGLPGMIKLSLRLASPMGKITSYTTTVALRARAAP